MIKLKNKFIGTALVGIMSIASISGVVSMTQNVNVVYAAESKALQNAKAKISHLTTSLKTNYLGIKNQGTWQLYIGQARNLISKIPNSETAQRNSLSLEVDKDESLVNALSRINQVEKSIQPKSEGGYGNYLGIKNADTWEIYLELARIDLDSVDTSTFKKQYNELISRMNKVSTVVKDIQNKFDNEYNNVIKLFEEAKASKNIEKAKSALIEAEKLGTCTRSDNLENSIKNFINGDSKQIIYDTYINDRYGFSVEYPNTFKKGFEGDNRAGMSLYSDDLTINVHGQNNVFEDDGYSYYNSYKEYVKGIILDHRVTKTTVEIISQENDNIIYFKAIVGKGSINVIELILPKAKGAEYKDIILHVGDSFKAPFVDYASDTAWIH